MTLAERIGQLARLVLVSDKAGEILAGRDTLIKTLATIGHDAYSAADTIAAALAAAREPPRENLPFEDEEWLQVNYVELFRHEKAGSVTCRVEFTVDGETYRDWLAFGRRGPASEVARARWLAMGGRRPIPRTADEAVAREGELASTIEILVRHDGRFWQIDGVRRG